MKKTWLQWIGGLAVMIGIGLPAFVSAQTAEIPFHRQAYVWKSGTHKGQKGTEAKTYLAESRMVEAASAPWLRLVFGQVKLGAKSSVTIISRKDGARQDLNAVTLAQWQNTSAYFNGDAVEVQIHAAPNEESVSLQIQELVVGEWLNGAAPPESQCGPLDDRVPSNHLASGRILSIGCTGWIVSNGLHVTAGHCSGGAGLVLQFNVPPSNPDGTLNNPGPQDQYSIDSGTWQFVNGGIGNDWGTFGVFNNSQTGLQPIQAQGASFTVVQNLGPPTIRITGFGVDFNDPTRTQTQQTHAGPNAGSSVTTMRYQTDTEGGNSGSPVIDDATGNAVGVHTHGGCSIGGGGNNSGTSTFNAAFWSALGGGGGGGCTNIAQGRPASASSNFNSSTNAPKAVDGNTSTYWRNLNAAPQQIRIDLGTSVSYDQVILEWSQSSPSRYAKAYTIDVSNVPNFSTLTTVFSTTTGSGGTETLALTGAPRTERYIRLRATVFNSGHLRLAEFKVCQSTSAARKQVNSAAEINVAVPTAIALYANYPNPFNPSTTIDFGLPQEAHVSLKVYNLIGEEVATLVNERRATGTHSVVFEAANLPSGVYFSVLNVGEVKLVRRLVLMK